MKEVYYYKDKADKEPVVVTVYLIDDEEEADFKLLKETFKEGCYSDYSNNRIYKGGNNHEVRRNA